MKVNNVQLRIGHAILSNLGLKDSKADILAGYGVESSKDLSHAQMEELIASLKKMQKAKEEPSKATRQKRSAVLDLLTKLGIYKDNNDWQQVNKYLLDKRIAGKLMYDMTDKELDALIRKLTAIHKKQEDQINAEKIWAVSN